MDEKLVDFSADSSPEISIWASPPHQFLGMDMDSTLGEPLPIIFALLPPLLDGNLDPSSISSVFSPHPGSLPLLDSFVGSTSFG